MYKHEIEDGGISYRELYTDEEGYDWHILIREGGSISLYATYPGDAVHYVAWDSLDKLPPNDSAKKVIAYFAEIAEGINALMTAVQSIPARAV